METEKIFYTEPYTTTFTAKVLACREMENGWAVYLDRTAFYPEGGGQACDLGTLDDVAVQDVQENAEGICHRCDRPLPEGKTVQGSINWQRRFDFMQQHTGEHIVSGIVYARYGYHNSGFHMGTDGMEVDFDGVIDPSEISGIEQAANEAVWADIPVQCWYPAQEELKTIFYRTKRVLPWPVRLVQISGIDSCACCGSHVRRTGEVGLIKISSCVRLRGGVRMVIRCGNRAWQHIGQIYEQNRRVSQILSVPMTETATAVEKLSDALANEKLLSGGLRKKMFAEIARQYAEKKNALHFSEESGGAQIRELADAIAENVEGWAAVFGGNGNYCIASRNEDLREMGKALNVALCGRGGGKPGCQQGHVCATRQAVEAFFSGYL